MCSLTCDSYLSWIWSENMRMMIWLFNVQHDQISWSFFMCQPSHCNIDSFLKSNTRIERFWECTINTIIFIIASRPPTSRVFSRQLIRCLNSQFQSNVVQSMHFIWHNSPKSVQHFHCNETIRSYISTLLHNVDHKMNSRALHVCPHIIPLLIENKTHEKRKPKFWHNEFYRCDCKMVDEGFCRKNRAQETRWSCFWTKLI